MLGRKCPDSLEAPGGERKIADVKKMASVRFPSGRHLISDP